MKFKDITGITLLSRKEYDGCSEFIPDMDGWWWLRDHNSKLTGFVNIIDWNKPDAHGSVQTMGGGLVRPVLLASPESCTLTCGEKRKAFGYNWTVISDHMLLCDEEIDQRPFNDPDNKKDVPDYDTSDIKAFLDDWFAVRIESVADPEAELKIVKEDPATLKPEPDPAQLFPYGTDIECYKDRALEKMKFTYPWASKELFEKKYTFAIEEESGKRVFAQYYKYSDGSSVRYVIDKYGDDIVDHIVSEWEFSAESVNPVIEDYVLTGTHGTIISGWHLERFVFRKHELGGYSSSITAGDRSAGGTRVFFIPPSFLEGTFEEFVSKYNEMVPGVFGLEERYYEDDPEGFKRFLGFM